MKNKLSIFLIAGICLLGLFLRFYKISSIPPGLERDETSIGYNAYSILQTGKDEYGKTFPLYFQAFGEYKLPGYIYASVIPIKLFGLNAFSVRFISALSGSLTIFFLYLLLQHLTKSKNSFFPIIGTFLLAINPWHIHFSRGAFEVTLALFFLVVGTWLFFISEKKKVLLIFAILFIMLAAYTYNIARIFSPVLLLSLFFFTKNQIKFSKKLFISSFVWAIILFLPIILTLRAAGGASSASGAIIFSSADTKATLLEFKSYLVTGYPIIFSKIFFSIPILLIWQYIINIISYISIPFFFLTGSSHGNHGIGNVGEFYLFELPTILIGLFFIFKEKIAWAKIYIPWAIGIILIAALTKDNPYATRSFFLIIPFIIFSAIGLEQIVKYFFALKNIGKIFLLLCLLFAAFNIMYYFTSYYFRFPTLYAKAWNQQDQALSNYIEKNQDAYKEVIFDTKANFPYTSFLFYSAYPPKKFQSEEVRYAADSEGFTMVKSFGEYEFTDNLSKVTSPNTLIVTNGDTNLSLPLVTSFHYPKRPIVIANGQNILQYPVTESAYVLYKTH
ncbi:MAG: ArnT family glycosyltransferase [Candidatus Levyibacteriota bacterium]